VLLAVGSTAWNAQPERGATDTNKVAVSLFSGWVLPFEIVGVLLLAAVIGGVFLAKRERGKDVLE
jgi:NADH:ubiquinone oxidoreductase subunit 6 (subunit J)